MSCNFFIQKFTFESQTASISATTLFTPTSDGDFLIQVTGDIFGHDSGGDTSSLSGTIAWTANDIDYQWQLNIINTYGNASPLNYVWESQQGTFTIHAKAGQAVALTTSWFPVGSPVGSQYYDLYITISGG
jgi:hypothetical protein